jgi:hypothetical protein
LYSRLLRQEQSRSFSISLFLYLCLLDPSLWRLQRHPGSQTLLALVAEVLIAALRETDDIPSMRKKPLIKRRKKMRNSAFLVFFTSQTHFVFLVRSLLQLC